MAYASSQWLDSMIDANTLAVDDNSCPKTCLRIVSYKYNIGES